MFRTPLIVFGSLWLVLAGLSIYALSYPSGADRAAYLRLIDFSRADKPEVPQQGMLLEQMREETTKQILYTQNALRLQSRLSSEHSQLVLEAKGDGSVEWREHFRGITFAGQERSSEGTEPYMGYFKADRASYAYKTGLLEAEEVEVAHYSLPFFLPPSLLQNRQPSMRGRAASLRLSLFDGASWQASGFRVLFYGEGS